MLLGNLGESLRSRDEEHDDKSHGDDVSHNGDDEKYLAEAETPGADFVGSDSLAYLAESSNSVNEGVAEVSTFVADS